MLIVPHLVFKQFFHNTPKLTTKESRVINMEHNQNDVAVETNAVSFNFRAVKDASTGEETKREAVVLNLPAFTSDVLLGIISNGGKEFDLLVEAAEAIVATQVRSILAEDTSLTSDTFPLSEVTWSAIANLPAATRTRASTVPTKEALDAFAVSYIETMQRITDKSLDKITKASKIFAGKCEAAKGKHDVLDLLHDQFSLYVQNATDLADHEAVVEYLNKRITALKELGSVDLLDAL